MSDTEIGQALFNASLVAPTVRCNFRRTRPELMAFLKEGAKAITQLWHDLEEEERASVGRKALA
ncbi:hypothetical protein [Acetobacter pasteurianus]|uniref:hypothetical protein n=1 Tax=Acetobacter pasteurianus TaxID=438 RepID=UPI000B3E4A14|nr:hypothetical protein [Acetobacter pasteurianus]